LGGRTLMFSIAVPFPVKLLKLKMKSVSEKRTKAISVKSVIELI
jgi:hypothetical protein